MFVVLPSGLWALALDTDTTTSGGYSREQAGDSDEESDAG